MGTGTGQIVKIIHQQFEHVFGLDISEKQIEEAKVVNKDITNASFHVLSYD